jgi:hypothetical protein
MSPTQQIFLSHSGHDAARATQFAATLEQELARLGHRVQVFNTSEPEHRYQSLQELLNIGEDWRWRAQQYEQDLRSYLRRNLEESAAFLVLVTPKSLAAASSVIEFEIEAAKAAAKEQSSVFFFPCVADGATLRDLPDGAQEFQGIALDAKHGLARLVEALDRRFSAKR